MFRVFAIVVWLASAVAAMDFWAEPGFEIGYLQVPKAAVSLASVGGRMELGLFRLAYSGSYLAMDSLYRQVYSEWDALATYLPKNRLGIVGGVGYGLSVDWVPENRDYPGESWTSNRYKVGAVLVKSPLSLSAITSLLNHASYCEFNYAVALRFDGGRLGVFVEYDGMSIHVGDYLKFSHVSLFSAYRFPDFAMSFSLVFTIGDWTLSGAYGQACSIWDWFGFSVAKSIRKKTIL